MLEAVKLRAMAIRYSWEPAAAGASRKLKPRYSQETRRMNCTQTQCNQGNSGGGPSDGMLSGTYWQGPLHKAPTQTQRCPATHNVAKQHTRNPRLGRTWRYTGLLFSWIQRCCNLLGVMKEDRSYRVRRKRSAKHVEGEGVVLEWVVVTNKSPDRP
jgi:hypothetical protein